MNDDLTRKVPPADRPAWMTALFDQLEAATEKLFPLERDRRVADAEGDVATVRERGRAIVAVGDEMNQLAAEIATRADTTVHPNTGDRKVWS